MEKDKELNDMAKFIQQGVPKNLNDVDKQCVGSVARTEGFMQRILAAIGGQI